MNKRLLIIGIMIITVLFNACSKDKNTISVEEDHINMNVGDKYTIKILEKDAENVVWESAAPEIAVVSADGTVSAISGGITTVSARTEDSFVHVGIIVEGNNYVDKNGNVIEVFDGVSDITEIVVGVKGGGKSDVSVKAGDTCQLRAYTTPSDSKDEIVWRTADASIAKVDEKGVMSVVGKGKTVISAYAPNGVKGELIVRSK